MPKFKLSTKLWEHDFVIFAQGTEDSTQALTKDVLFLRGVLQLACWRFSTQRPDL